MREFGKISSTIWRSKKFRALPDTAAKLVYFYLHTCDSGNSIGAFYMPPEKAYIDMRMPIEQIKAAYADLEDAQLIRFDAEEEYVQIVGFITHTPPSSFKHLSGVDKLFRVIPPSTMKDILANEIADVLNAKAQEWSDEIESKKRFIERAEQLRSNHPIHKGIHTPTDTPIHRVKNDTPIHTPTDTLDTDKTQTQREKETETETPADDSREANLTFRERIMETAQIELCSPSGRINGSNGDMIEAQRWIDDLGLTEDECINVIVEVMAKKRDGPPTAFRYFNGPMEDFAAIKAQPALQPSEQPKGMKRRKPQHDITSLAEQRATLRPPSMGHEPS